MTNNLWICWEEPDRLPSNNTVVLSFLRPAKEEKLKNKFKGRLISSRQIAGDVREQARKIYVNLIAKIGTAPLKGGRTLREALKRKDGVSLWWFHNVSHKDCESDPTFNFIVEIFIIISVTKSLSNKRIVLFGGYREISGVLKNIFKVKEIRCRREYGVIYTFIRALGGRGRYLILFLFRRFIIKRSVKNLSSYFDVVFSGFWDWSINEDKGTNRLNDRYFKSLPDELSAKDLKVGWFLWIDPISQGRNLRSILEPLKKHSNLVVLQSLIKISELLKAVLNFKPYLIFRSFSRTEGFKKAFIEEGINFYPLLQSPLIYDFLNSRIPHFELVYTASLKAFKKYRPKLSVSFLELFLYSRAFYAGSNKGSPNTINCAVQHASYSREKTFVLLDPQIEYKGCYDKCAMPKPDYVFAMGELGKEIFIESGFPEDRIFLTGSSRYEHIRDTSISRENSFSKSKNIFIVTSMDRELDIDMVEAVCAASENLPGARLFLRSHPFAKMEEYPNFRTYSDRIQVTKGTLEEDFRKADLIIFSYSTVGEEALIRGIPVWQWLPVSYNGSVFRDLKVIPAFYSVSDLREAMKNFLSDADSFAPDDKIRDFIVKKCFYAADGKSSERIADCMTECLLAAKKT